MKPTVHLLSVKHPKEKLDLLYEKSLFHLENKLKLIILCEDDKTVRFVANLLWSYLPDSFIPHSIRSGSETITITDREENTKRSALFNLKATAPQHLQNVYLIYDFNDHTSPDKEKAAEEKHKAYIVMGCNLSV